MLAVLIRNAPYGALEAAEGLRHLGGTEVLGFDDGVGVFVDDGVYVLRRNQVVPEDRTSLEHAIADLLGKGAKLVADEESLAKRNLASGDLIEGVEIADSVSKALLKASTVLVF